MSTSDKEITDYMREHISNLEKYRIHGKNLRQKYFDPKKYNDQKSKEFLFHISQKYLCWKNFNDSLIAPTDLSDEKYLQDTVRWRVKAYNEYRKFINLEKYVRAFDSRSNLHSSSLEEFIYYLFKDIAKSSNSQAVVGKSRSYKDLYFSADSYEELVKKPEVHIEKKDHDFIIGASVSADFKVQGSAQGVRANFDIPAIAIECKTYIDKTMLEGASSAAEQLKTVNPNARYYIVAEYVKLSNDINFKKYKFDQIFILRKQKNKDQEYTFGENSDRNPVFADPVYKLVKDIYIYLTEPWESSLDRGIERGYLIPE